MEDPAHARPKVSVLVTTYNHERYIAAAMDSALSQETTFPFEIVAGDDGSTDRTGEILEEYARAHPGVVTVIRQPRNVGAWPNTKAVFLRAAGDYWVHLEGDDLYLPGKLQRQADFLDAHPECSACVHDVRAFDDATGKTLEYVRVEGLTQFGLEEIIERGAGTFFANLSKMYRRASFPLDCVPPDRGALMDWLIHIENAKHGRFGWIPGVLADYRRHPGGMTRQPGEAAVKLFRLTEEALEHARGLVPDELIEDAHRKILFTHGVKFLTQRDYARYAEWMKRFRSARGAAPMKQQIFARLHRTPRLARLLWRSYIRAQQLRR